MKGKYLTIEDAKKLSNYEKLLAENSLLKSNAENIKIVIKKKNKTIEELNKKIKCLEDEGVNMTKEFLEILYEFLNEKGFFVDE